MADRYAAIRRGEKALEQATLAQARADAAKQLSTTWCLRALGRRSHALRMCHDPASTADGVRYFEVMIQDALARAHEALDVRDNLLDEALAFEMRSRIAYEEAEERYAMAPDDDWEKLLKSVQTAR